MRSFLFLILLCFGLGACSTLPVTEPRKTALYESKPVSIETGIASWYKDHRTASGERFDIHALAAAHKRLPFGTKVRVVDLKTEKSIIVRINDRGPYKKGRVIDLTVGAARQLGMYERGIAKVRLEVLKEIPILQKPNLHTKTETPSSPSKKPQAESSRAEQSQKRPSGSTASGSTSRKKPASSSSEAPASPKKKTSTGASSATTPAKPRPTPAPAEPARSTSRKTASTKPEPAKPKPSAVAPAKVKPSPSPSPTPAAKPKPRSTRSSQR